MNLRKFVAPNSRAALKLVRDALGPEAVVLSTRQAGGQCEILALPREEAERIAAPPVAAAPKAVAPVQAREVPLEHWVRKSPEPKAPPAPAPRSQASAPRPVAESVPLLDELKQLRSLIKEQGATLAWMESGHRRPLRAALMREMLSAGFSAWLAREVTGRLPDDFAEDRAHAWLRESIQRNLACAASPESLLDGGGVIALVGPTGVGKTTTTAKLAARCVVRHGAQAVGLVSTDTYRIGAQDQLRIYGKILGVPVQVCHDAAALQGVLASMAGKRVVLVDTVGMGQRDARVREQTAMLEACNARRVLLLNAALQPDALDEVARAYAGARPMAGALSKIDEAVTLGGALEVAMRRRLPLQFITNGQRVPEDLHPASAALLAHRALRVAPRPWAPREDEFGLVAAASTAPLAGVARG